MKLLHWTLLMQSTDNEALVSLFNQLKAGACFGLVARTGLKMVQVQNNLQTDLLFHIHIIMYLPMWFKPPLLYSELCFMQHFSQCSQTPTTHFKTSNIPSVLIPIHFHIITIEQLDSLPVGQFFFPLYSYTDVT